MVCFQTKIPDSGKFWDILFGTFCIHFFLFWDHLPRKIWQPWFRMMDTFPRLFNGMTAVSVLVEGGEDVAARQRRVKLVQKGRILKLKKISHLSLTHIRGQGYDFYQISAEKN
jgi:hypothetical protein